MDKIRRGGIVLSPGTTEELEEFKKERKKDKTPVKRGNAAIAAAFLILLLLWFGSLAFFVVPTVGKPDLAYFATECSKKFAAFISYLSGDTAAYSVSNIVRYTVIVISGAALASAGVVFQGSFKNIIASPTTMGVQSGASLGNALYLLLFTSVIEGTVIIEHDNEGYYKQNFFEQNMQQIFAMIGSFIAIIAVVFITYSLGKGRFSSANILFGGMIFSAFTGAVTNVIQYYFLFSDIDNTRLSALRVFSMGSFDRVLTVRHLAFMSAVLLPCLIALFLLSPKLNILVMGEDEARSMGVNVRVLKVVIVAIGTLMSSVIFAFCGSIGFVGFIVPQIARRIVGPDFKKLIPMTIALGGILMILVYDIALYMGFSAYLNMIVSVIGCIMMIGSFLKKEGSSYDYE